MTQMTITMIMITMTTTMATQIPTISPIGEGLGSTTMTPGLLVDKTFSVDVLVSPPLDIVLTEI